MDKSRIISEIERRVNNFEKGDYAAWTVGISDTPKVRKDQHEKDGREIEDYFLGKGMRGDAGGGSAGYVFIF